MDETLPIEQQVEHLLKQAKQFHASDILFVPNDATYQLYFRKFHRLFEVEDVSFERADRFFSHLKFQASLDIGDQRKPQSGAFSSVIEDEKVAFRISTLPSAFSKESLIIRMMYYHESKEIHDLPVFEQSGQTLVELINHRQGLILLTGATGSGKSTTLYSLVQSCAKEGNKQVISLEDPVEHPQANLLQVQVNERAGVTYETGLKAILRHSPDVLMIGEIRDRKTAEIAVEAALTGHLVLSTIHAKDTLGCIYRLLDLGIQKSDLQQTLLSIVAQKLVPVPRTEGVEVRALYEFLQQEQIEWILEENIKHLPSDFQTLAHQYELGVKNGAILDSANIQQFSVEPRKEKTRSTT